MIRQIVIGVAAFATTLLLLARQANLLVA